MRVNGELRVHHEGLTLHRLLDELLVNQGAVVIMHGNQIYRAGAIPDVPVAELDVIEIVRMMQGG